MKQEKHTRSISSLSFSPFTTQEEEFRNAHRSYASHLPSPVGVRPSPPPATREKRSEVKSGDTGVTRLHHPVSSHILSLLSGFVPLPSPLISPPVGRIMSERSE